MTVRQWCIRHGNADGWHITHAFVENADPIVVKRDGPFIAFATGEAYEIVGDCPLIPDTYDCVIRDTKAERAEVTVRKVDDDGS